MRSAYFADLPYYATYISNWHHNATFMSISWSLSTEEQFYFIWPAIQKAFTTGSAIFILSIFLVFNQCVNFEMLPLFLSPEKAEYFESLEIVQCTFTPLCLGIFIAYILHEKKSFWRN